MSLTVPPELERRVIALARETARDPSEVLANLLDDALDDDAEFRASVRAGVAQLDAGESVPHEQVLADLRAILAQHAPR